MELGLEHRQPYLIGDECGILGVRNLGKQHHEIHASLAAYGVGTTDAGVMRSATAFRS